MSDRVSLDNRVVMSVALFVVFFFLPLTSIADKNTTVAGSQKSTVLKSDTASVKRARFLISSHKFHPDRILVKFKPNRFPEQIVRSRKLASTKGAARQVVTLPNHYKSRGVISLKRLLNKKTQKSSQRLRSVYAKNRKNLERWTVVNLKKGLNIEEVLAAFLNDPDVEDVSPNYEVSINELPLDPLVDKLWGFNNTSQIIPAIGIPRQDADQAGITDADIDGPEAWDVTRGNASVVVAVIDTGVDYTHEDLAGNMWINPDEIIGNSIDDDGNGYVDDIYGVDFVNNDGDPLDDHGHGTHVAGTISAVADNGVGIAGVASGVKIMALKFLNAAGRGFIDNAAMALDYAQSKNVRISNNSWGGGGFSPEFMTILTQPNADGGDHLMVAAAGNRDLNSDNKVSSIERQGKSYYPQGYELPNVLSVGASDFNDERAFFSNYGVTSVDVFAPGVAIYSTVPRAGCALCDSTGYGWLSGTSMATPHVSGVAALLLSQNPGLTARQLKSRIMASIDIVDSLQKRSVTSGRINAHSALTCNDLTPVLRTNLQEGSFLYKGEEPVPLRVTLFSCDDMLSSASVTVRFSNGEADIILYDDGLNNDEQAGDGIYGSSWIPSILGPVKVNFTAVDTQGTVSKLVNTTVKFRYYRYESSVYNWIDASQDGVLYSIANGASQDLPIGFDFSFYGQPKNNIRIWPNGTITFSDDVGIADDSQLYPDKNTANGMISPLWMPNIGSADTVYVLNDGVAPNRRITIMWSLPEVPVTAGAARDAHIFEATLHEGSGDIVFQYLDVPDKANYGEWATVGVEDIYGFDGTTYLFNDSAKGLRGLFDQQVLNPLVSKTAILFLPVGFPQDNLAPVAAITAPTSGFVGNSINFSGINSSDPEGQPLQYLWDFGDGVQSAGQNSTHVFTTPGTFNVTLLVYDAVIYSAPFVVSIDIVQGDPNLVITSIIGEDGKTSGNITLQATLKNIGTGASITGNSVFYYLSIDSQMGNDIYLGSDTVSESIESQASSFPSLTTRLPANMTPGTYRPIAVTGQFPGLTNSSGVNNFRLMGDPLNITIGPDLEAVDIIHPGSAVSGDAMVVTLSMRNNGTASATTVRNKIYLSTDAIVTSADIELGEVSVYKILSGQVNSGLKTLTIPAVLASGNYYIGAIVDWGNTISEQNEDNNTYVSTRTIAIGVANESPTAVMIKPATAATRESINFDGSTSSDPESDPLYYRWDFGDGNSSTERQPIFSYTRPGTYTVTLIVNDGIQDSVAVSSEIIISDGADLVVLAVIPTDTQLYLGGSTSVSFAVSNIGSASVLSYNRNRFTITGYIDSDNDPGNGYIKQVFTQNYSVAPLPGDTTTLQADIKFDGNVGSQYVWFSVSTIGECATCLDNNTGVSALAVDVQLNVDLRITDVSPDFTVITPGGYFNISSTVINGGLSQTNSSHRVQLYLSDDPVITTQDQLLTGANWWNPGIVKAGASKSFDRNVGISTNTQVGTYYLGAIADATYLQTETIENNNGSSPVKIQVVLPDVDLAISDITVIKQNTPILNAFEPVTGVAQGSTLALTINTTNLGTTNPTSTWTKLFLSSDKIVDALDAVIDNWSVPQLSGGTITSHDSFLTIDPTLVPGDYFIIAVADFTESQLESNETNNTRFIALQIIAPSPDLIVSSLSASVTQVGLGDSITISSTVLNQGISTTVNTFNIGLYLSADSNITTDDRLIQFRGITGLLPGVSDQANSSAYISTTQAPGCYYLGAIVDYSQRVDEPCSGCELNNSLLGPEIAIGNASCGPINNPPVARLDGPYNAKTTQLISFSSAGSADPEGDALTYLWNFGDGSVASIASPSHAYAAAGIYTVTLVVNDGTQDSLVATSTVTITINAAPVAVLSGPVAGAKGAITTFDGSASYDADNDLLVFNWDFGDGTSITGAGAVQSHTYASVGTFTVSLIVNDGIVDSIPITSTVTITAAASFTDLVMTAVNGPANAGTGESITITSTVVNQGSARTNAYTYVTFFLSSDAVYDPGDQFLSRRGAGYLNAGQIRSPGGSITIPANTIPGTYYLLAVADVNNGVAESDDPDNLNGNNLAISPVPMVVTVGADLAMTAVSGPAAVRTGESVTITSTVINQGVGRTNGYVFVAYYFSSDTVYDPGDKLLSRRGAGYLNAGQSSSPGGSITIPASTIPGTYYLLAVTDVNNGVAESDDPDNLNGNNLAISPVPVVVTVGADLAMTAVSGPAAAGRGESITITSTVINQGVGSTNGYVFVAYYLSSDTVYDTGDNLLSRRGAGYMNAGQSRSPGGSIIIPANTIPGTYYLLAVADVNNGVAESDDPDNLNGNNLYVGGQIVISP